MAQAVWIQQMGEPPVLEFGPAAPIVAVGEHGPEIALEFVAADVVPLDRQIAAGKFPPSGPTPIQAGVSAVARRVDTGALVSVQGGHAQKGFRSPGCFAERFSAPASLLCPIPDGLDPLQAAAGLETGITAELILTDHAALQPGERVLVLGANGGVGRACVQLAVAAGAEVIAVVRDPASYVVPVDADIKVISPEGVVFGMGVNVIVDPIGGPMFQQAILAGAHQCRHVFLGYNAGAVVELRLPLLMIAEHRILGFNEHTVSNPRFMAVAALTTERIATGVLRSLVAGTVALADAAVAYASAGSVGRTLLVC